MTSGAAVLDVPEATQATDRRWPYWSVITVLVVGLLVTGGLVATSAVLYRHNENRLLKLRTRDIGSVLTATLPSIQTSMASSAAFADATNGNVQKFQRFVAPLVGQASGAPFASVSLWRADQPQRGPLVVVGSPPVLTPAMPRTSAFFAHAEAIKKLTVLNLVNEPTPRVGYAFAEPTTGGPYAVYAESALPAHRYSATSTNSSFTDLNYALYLGTNPSSETLLITSAKSVPLSGHRAVVTIPFGDTVLTVRATARGPLEGSLPQKLPWVIGIAGLLLTLGAAALTMRLIDRRGQAEELAVQLEQVADENRRLYAEQHGIAQTLQHALLPEVLPQVPGLQTSARYEAGVDGIDIGGDWYDVIAVDDKHLMLVVGDVSGRGLRAATTMAALRYAIHAYAAQGDPPETILTKLSTLVSVKATGQIATVMCALIDADRRTLTITSAGHLPPLLISDGHSEFIKSDVGLPIGVDRHAAYSSATIQVPSGATLLAFTDGLVERRGESIDAGLGRLLQYATSNNGTLDDLLTKVVSSLRHDGSDDDTAIAGIRWLK